MFGQLFAFGVTLFSELQIKRAVCTSFFPYAVFFGHGFEKFYLNRFTAEQNESAMYD
jgi:hypothetical protein